MDPTQDSSVSNEPSAIEQLRNEFTEQFNTLRQSYEDTNKSLNEKLTNMSKENEELKRALIRSAVVPQQENTVKEPTEEELYAQHIKELASQTVDMMSRIY